MGNILEILEQHQISNKLKLNFMPFFPLILFCRFPRFIWHNGTFSATHRLWYRQHKRQPDEHSEWNAVTAVTVFSDNQIQLNSLKIGQNWVQEVQVKLPFKLINTPEEMPLFLKIRLWAQLGWLKLGSKLLVLHSSMHRSGLGKKKKSPWHVWKLILKQFFFLIRLLAHGQGSHSFYLNLSLPNYMPPSIFLPQ